MRFLGISLDAWNTIGTWFSAVATTTVAIVALRLAARDKWVMLEVQVNRRVVFSDAAGRLFAASRDAAVDAGFTGRDAIEIVATNIGHRPVVVTGIYWRVPWVFRKKGLKRGLYQMSPINQLTDVLPWRLSDGQWSRLMLFEDEFLTLNKNEWKLLGSKVRWKPVAMRFMKVGIVTTVGRPIERRLSKEMAEFLGKAADVT